MNFASLFNMMLLVYYKPFIKKWQNIQEIINEVMILVVVYHLFYFTAWNYDMPLRDKIGKSLVVLLLINIFLINLLPMAYVQVKETIVNYRNNKVVKQNEKTLQRAAKRMLDAYQNLERFANNEMQRQKVLQMYREELKNEEEEYDDEDDFEDEESGRRMSFKMSARGIKRVMFDDKNPLAALADLPSDPFQRPHIPTTSIMKPTEYRISERRIGKLVQVSLPLPYLNESEGDKATPQSAIEKLNNF